MKVNSSRFGAAYTAGAACFALTLLFTSCVSSSALTSRQDITNPEQSVTFKLQPQFEMESVRLFIQKPPGKIVWVKFIDIDGTILERFCAGKQEKTIDRSYNFRGAEEGVYSFEISDGEKITTKKVTLQREDVKTVTRLVIE